MTIDEMKTTIAWQDSIQLAKELVDICEQFSDADASVLVWHLRQAIVEIPAGVASDLQEGGRPNLEPVVKLVATLELVTKIYPAIETAPAEEVVQRLVKRMEDGDFSERREDQSAPAAAGTEADESDDQPESTKQPVGAEQPQDPSEIYESADTSEEELEDEDEVRLPTSGGTTINISPKIDGVGRQRSR